jgi:hypothetical protein
MRATAARDAGLALVSRINRWLIAGAVTLTAVFSAFAAHTFRGHGVALAGTGVTHHSHRRDDEPGGGLQHPAQAPAPAQPSPAPVVSGGS